MDTTTEPVTEPEVEMALEPWKRVLRIATAAIVIALLGLVLGGISVLGQARQVSKESAETSRESAQTAWDQKQGAHQRCVDAAESRAITIETGHDQFNGQLRQIAGRLDTVDLIEGIAGLFPPSEVIDQALVKTQQSRERIQMDAIQTAAELAEFDAKRPPLDPNNCPPPPDGERP